MKSALIVTTVSGFVPQFEMNNVRILQAMGYEVHYASNFKTPSYGTDNKRLEGTGIVRHQIDFVRSPFALAANKKVYQQLKKLMTDIKFDLVHCHTPMGGALARMVAKSACTAPVIYTVHGFHFYKGAPILNWLIYYPVEKLLSKYTDVLITINQEDYKKAKMFSAKNVNYIPGVGIDIDKINQLSIDRTTKKKELGIPKESIVILSVGELIKRKNYFTGLEAFAKANLENTVYVICGHGKININLKDFAIKLGIEDKVIFAGYRNDVIEVMKCADIFFFPSYQEGLPAALMEAMACGLPVVCSKIRGNSDLIEHNKGGFLYPPNNVDNYSNAITKLVLDCNLRSEMGEINRKELQNYDIKYIGELMSQIYMNVELGN